MLIFLFIFNVCFFTIADQSQHIPEPSEQRDIIPHYSNRPYQETHFFAYLTLFSLISITAYIGYHNKQKVNFDHFLYFFFFLRELCLVTFVINVLVF